KQCPGRQNEALFNSLLGRDRDERATRSFIANAIVEPGSLRTQPRDVSPGRYARGRPQSFRYAHFPAWAGEAQCALPRPHAWRSPAGSVPSSVRAMPVMRQPAFIDATPGS
ncbi:hypothetical protein, partial [Burkholderia pseudomallei]